MFTERSEHGPLRPVRSRFKVENPEGFFRHVAGTSTLQADKIFAQLAIWLVSAFANQGASERTNKYLAEIHSKKRAQLNLEKGEVMLEVKMRFEHYGWCKGTITGKVVDRRRTINKEAINFIAEFDIDDGASTDLSLDVSEYDPSPSADYQSWLLLQEAAG